MITLYSYQQEGHDKTIELWNNGINSVVVNFAMGLGKTEVALGILRTERKKTPNFRALWIVHREELVTDPKKRIIKDWLGQLPVPGIVMNSSNDVNAELVCASIQTLQARKNGTPRKKFSRLRKVLERGAFTHLVIDECHHAPAKSYRDLIRALHTVNPDLKHLGLTATVRRTDKIGLDTVYDKIAYKVGLVEAVYKYQRLVPPNYWTIPLEKEIADFSQATTNKDGDYTDKSVSRIMSAANVSEIIVKKWQELGDNRPTMAFTAGVEQARSLAWIFQEHDVTAAYVSYKTSKTERRRIIKQFKRGDIKVLCNFGIFTEGFNVPEIGTVIMARPTKSDTVYLQAVGRGLRTHPSKHDCIILDFAPVNGRDLISCGDLFGKPIAQKKKEREAEDAGLLYSPLKMTDKAQGIDMEPDAVVMERFNLLLASHLRWMYGEVREGVEVAVCGIGKDMTLAVVMPQLDRIEKAEQLMEDGKWNEAWRLAYEQVRSHRLYMLPKRGLPEKLGQDTDWATIAQQAEIYAVSNGEPILMSKAKAWHGQSPSAGQLKFARRLGIDATGETKGSLANRITFKLASNQLIRGGLLRRESC